MSVLGDILSGAGNLLDTPGSIVRGLAAGDPGRALSGILDPSQRLSGRDLLEKWGVADKDSGIGADLGGIATQIALDPLTYAGGFLLKKLLGKAGQASEVAPKRYWLNREGRYVEVPAVATKEPIYAHPTTAERAEQAGLKIFDQNPMALSGAESGAAGSSGNVSDLLNKRRMFTTAKDVGFSPEGVMQYTPTGGQMALEPGMTPAARASQIQSGVEDFLGEAANRPDMHGQYNPGTRTASIAEYADPGIARHESYHGILDMARRSEDTSGLNALARASISARNSDSPSMRTIGYLLEELGAHGAASRGTLPQLRNMVQYLARPHPGYYDEFSRFSPMVAELYKQTPRIAGGLAGAGAAGLAGAIHAASGASEE